MRKLIKKGWRSAGYHGDFGKTKGELSREYSIHVNRQEKSIVGNKSPVGVPKRHTDGACLRWRIQSLIFYAGVIISGCSASWLR